MPDGLIQPKRKKKGGGENLISSYFTDHFYPEKLISIVKIEDSDLSQAQQKEIR